MSDVVVPAILSLASGGGGLDAGVALALGGCARTVCFVENEVTAARALVAGMEAQLLDDAPIWSDLRTFDGASWRGLVEGVIGGYPCQPFSVAGRRRGAVDPRHLWPYIADIVRAVEPRWCFFENVSGHLRLGFREVAEELRGMGYRVAATLVRAEEVGAPHRRERLFIMAHANRLGDERRGITELVGGAQGAEPREARQRERDGHAANHRVAAVDDPICKQGRGWEVDRPNAAHAESSSAGVGYRYPPNRADDDGWRRVLSVRPDLAPAIEPAVRSVVDGSVLARTDWLRILGNGVVPEQAALAFRELWAALS